MMYIHVCRDIDIDTCMYIWLWLHRDGYTLILGNPEYKALVSNIALRWGIVCQHGIFLKSKEQHCYLLSRRMRSLSTQLGEKYVLKVQPYLDQFYLGIAKNAIYLKFLPLTTVPGKLHPHAVHIPPGDAACLLASCSRNSSISACCVLILALSCLGFAANPRSQSDLVIFHPAQGSFCDFTTIHRAFRLKHDFPGFRLFQINLTIIPIFQGCPEISWVQTIRLSNPKPFFGV